MPELSLVRLLDRKSDRPVNLLECDRLPIQEHKPEAVVALDVLARWLVKHYQVGRLEAGPEPLLISSDPLRPVFVPRCSPAPHAILRDRRDGMVFVEVRATLGLPNSGKTTRCYQLSAATIQGYFKGAGYDAVTQAQWSGKTAGKAKRQRDGREQAKCLQAIRRYFRRFLAGRAGTGRGWPTFRVIAKECECSTTPVIRALEEFRKTSEYQRWEQENPGAYWGPERKKLRR